MNAEGNEVSLYSASNYIDESERKTLGARIFPPESFVFPKVGGAIATNKKRRISVNSCVDNNVMGLIPDQREVHPTFLGWWLAGFDIYEFSNKANPPSITQSTVSNWPFVLPPLEEQQRIVAILDEAFEGLDRARANAEANYADAQSLFEATRSYALRPTDNWMIKPLSNCFRLKSGDNLTSKDMKEGPFSVYGGNGIAGTHSYSNLSGPNVIVGRVGALCGNARFINEDIWLTDNAFKVTDYQVAFDPCFLSHLLNEKRLRSLARQSAQPVISNSSLADLMLSFPKDIADQIDIAEKLEMASAELGELSRMYSTKLQDLDDLRQSLLQKAFAGELT